MNKEVKQLLVELAAILNVYQPNLSTSIEIILEDESKIAELQQELDEVNAWFNRDKDLNDYYNDLSEPKYKGKGEHNINQLEAIIAEYQELVHKLKVRLQ